MLRLHLDNINRSCRETATIVLLCVGLIACPAWADIAATADFVQGQVSAIRHQQAPRALLEGGDVYDQDDIHTGPDSRVQLRFTDDGLVSLMPDTHFSVQEYQLADDGTDGSLVFSLLSGGLRTVTGAIGKVHHESYEIKTPVGTLGVRGTEFTAILDSLDTLLVHVGRGKVVLSNDYGVLEIPAGSNGIMMLHQAPNFSQPDMGGTWQMPDSAAAADASLPALELPLPAPQDLGVIGDKSPSPIPPPEVVTPPPVTPPPVTPPPVTPPPVTPPPVTPPPVTDDPGDDSDISIGVGDDISIGVGDMDGGYP